MNIHGLKQSMKKMTRIIKKEEAKPLRNQNTRRIRILRDAKRGCSSQIKRLKEERDKKRK